MAPALASIAFAICNAADGGGSVRGAICNEIALVEGKAPEWVQLFPAGPELEALDGRKWKLSDPGRVASASMGDGLDLPLDWEHSQYHRAPRGEEAPAAGWIRRIAVRDGLVMARIDWTGRGKASVERREYRYLSPEFLFDETSNEVLRVRGAGLVNHPAFIMPALAGQEVNTVLKKILAALGLAADATEEQALEAVASLKSERDTAVAAAASPPLDRFVPRADHDAAVAARAEAETRVAELEAAARDSEIEQLLDEAQEAGKITPATRDYHAAQCRAEGGIERFKAYAAAAPEIGGAGGGSAAPPHGNGSAAGFQSAEEAAIARMFGRDAAFLDEHAPREVS